MHSSKTSLNILWSKCSCNKLAAKSCLLFLPFKQLSNMHVAGITPNEPPHDDILQPLPDGQTLHVATIYNCEPLHYVHA